MSETRTEIRFRQKLLAWIIDQVVVASACFALILVLVQVGLSENVEAWAAIGVLLVTPALVGALCVRGRTPGTLAIGTEFFSLATGRTAGSARMAWIVLVRWLLPISAVLFLVAMFTSAGSGGPPAIHDQRSVRRA